MASKMLYTVAEFVELIGISRSKTYQLIATGELETVKVGTRRLVPHEAAEAFVATLRAASFADLASEE